jgi:hypothetical protein
MDQRQRCAGSISSDLLGTRVWQAVETLLQNPELILAEVKRSQQRTDELKADVARQLDMIEGLLAKIDREDERWTQAYAAEVIDLGELKHRRAEIQQRHKSLQEQQAQLDAELTQVKAHVHQRDQIMAYCTRVRAHLQAFSFQEKRVALRALEITVHWSVEADLSIRGVIPVGTPTDDMIMSNPSGWSVPPTLAARTAPGRHQRCPG